MQPRVLIVLYTSLAMVAFASNSLLNKLALGRESIDAVSYTAVRLIAGALTLWLISALQKNNVGSNVRGQLDLCCDAVSLRHCFFVRLS